MQPLALPCRIVGIVHFQLRQRRLLPLQISAVKDGELVYQYSDRPPVGDDVVHTDQQCMFLAAEPYQRHPQQWPLCQIEFVTDFIVNQIGGNLFLLFFLFITDVDPLQVKIMERQHLLHRDAIARRKPRAQNSMPPDNFVQCLVDGRDRKLSFQANDEGNVVSGAG